MAFRETDLGRLEICVEAMHRHFGVSTSHIREGVVRQPQILSDAAVRLHDSGYDPDNEMGSDDLLTSCEYVVGQLSELVNAIDLETAKWTVFGPEGATLVVDEQEFYVGCLLKIGSDSADVGRDTTLSSHEVREIWKNEFATKVKERQGAVSG